MKTLAPLLCALLLISCSSSRSPEAEAGRAVAELHSFESDFRPSDYEPDPTPSDVLPPTRIGVDTIQLDLPPTETAEAHSSTSVITRIALNVPCAKRNGRRANRMR